MKITQVEFKHNRFYMSSLSYQGGAGVAYYKKFIGIILECFGYAKKFNYTINKKHHVVYLNKKSFVHWKKVKKAFIEDQKWEKNEGIALSYDKVMEAAEEKFKSYPDREKILEFIKMKLGECAYKEKIENGEIFKFVIFKGEHYEEGVLEDLRESRIDQNIPLSQGDIKAVGEEFIKWLPSIHHMTEYNTI